MAASILFYSSYCERVEPIQCSFHFSERKLLTDAQLQVRLFFEFQ